VSRAREEERQPTMEPQPNEERIHLTIRAAAYTYSNVAPRGQAMNRPGPSGSSSP
jgi:hypothetical protein